MVSYDTLDTLKSTLGIQEYTYLTNQRDCKHLRRDEQLICLPSLGNLLHWA